MPKQRRDGFSKDLTDKIMLDRKLQSIVTIAEAHMKMTEHINKRASEILRGTKAADTVLMYEFDEVEDGELFIKAIHCLVDAGIIERTPRGYNWFGKQADLRRFCDVFDFRWWTKLSRFITVKGRDLSVRSIANDIPPRGGPTWKNIEKVLIAGGYLDPPIQPAIK
jgi:hypothetical protein